MQLCFCKQNGFYFTESQYSRYFSIIDLNIFFNNFSFDVHTSYYLKYPTLMINSLPMLLLICLCLLPVGDSKLKKFGMNKPHYLFHLGDRHPISTNIGWGYWSDESPIRLRYANTNQQLYAHMTFHDGNNFMEKVEDTRSGINSTIKYQTHEDYWEVEIEMENVVSNLTTWFMYYSVENNDYKLIDHKKYSSYIYFKPNKPHPETYTRSTDILSYAFQNQTLSLSQTISQEGSEHPEQPVPTQIFGLSANISETYAISNMADVFQHLVRVSRGEELIEDPKNPKEKKILDWEKRQLKFISDNNWENQTYVVVFHYGTIPKGQKSKLYLTNSSTRTQQFSTQQFTKKQTQFSTLFLNHPQQKFHNFLQHIISNLYAGLTFYHGRLYTQNSLISHRQDYSFSFTPSRLIFPRSFLWDDGFHQSVIVHYNTGIIIDVLVNWMNKVDVFGWIGREQIRGAEISSMMPDSRFVFQDWFQMNPPTLIMTIQSLIDKSSSSQSLKEDLTNFLSSNYHKLQLWYRYFKQTQSHQSLQYPQTMNRTDRFYRWHCKDECSKGNFMGSGLDDYPRRNQDTQIAKQHVDLVSWLYFFANGLQHIAKFMHQNGKQVRVRKYTRRMQYYAREAQHYVDSLYESFYDRNDNLFKDVVVAGSDQYIEKFVNKIGYINLFPFFTGMLSQQQSISNQESRVKSLKKILQIMSDEKLLLSEDGLRSLSVSDPLYGTDDNYWRGAVWLPINYMVLRACKKYYWNDPQVSTQIHNFYNQLRNRLIKSVYGTYEDTGYLFENYYQGRGHRGYPFYGWTATIANIIREYY